MDYSAKTFESYEPGGGGWASSQNEGGGFGPSSQASPGASQGQKKKFESQSLVSVTTKQLKTAVEKDSKFVIDGKEISQISLVGHVIGVEVQSTNIRYTLDDGTGMIPVRMYIDLEEGGEPTIRENTYVKIFGNIRSLNNEMSVVAFQIVPVTDHNEITFHMLETIHQHLYNTRGPMKGSDAPLAAKAEPYSSTSSSYVGGQIISSDMGAVGSDSSLGSVQQAVLQIFTKNSSNDSGISVAEVCQQLKSIQASEIRQAVEHLCNEGHLYSTIDEEHYRCTSAD